MGLARWLVAYHLCLWTFSEPKNGIHILAPKKYVGRLTREEYTLGLYSIMGMEYPISFFQLLNLSNKHTLQNRCSEELQNILNRWPQLAQWPMHSKPGVQHGRDTGSAPSTHVTEFPMYTHGRTWRYLCQMQWITACTVCPTVEASLLDED